LMLLSAPGGPVLGVLGQAGVPYLKELEQHSLHAVTGNEATYYC
jgi:hypothetical protein